MFKLVVLFALVAAAVAKPGALSYGVAPLAYSAYSAPAVVAHAAPVAVPTAYSHQSRTDVHHKGVVATTYTAPAVVATHTSYAAPAVAAYTAPVAAYAAPVAAYNALPYSGYTGYAAGVYGHGYGYASPYGYY